MNNGTSRRRSGGRNRRSGAKSVDLWRPVPQLSPPSPISAAGDPTALLKSLGDPPLHGRSIAAGVYLSAAVERASGLATALAAAAGLLDQPDDEEL